MRREVCLPVFLVLFVLSSAQPGSPAAQQETATDPVEGESGRVARIEIVAMDARGRTVADLTQEDFRVTVGGEPAPLVAFDSRCPIGAMPDPEPIHEGDPAPAPIAPGTPRRIVLAVDYDSLDARDRSLVLDAAKSMVIANKTPAEQIMIVALAGAVRVEQGFTGDSAEVVESLSRMKHDATLWGREPDPEAGGKGYLDRIATLMDVLEPHEGPKAVVVFSTLLTKREPDEAGMREIASRAAEARVAIYPTWARGLQFGTARQDTHALRLLATETGGRPPVATGDLSLQYRRAQRDLSCRYVPVVRLGDDDPERPLGVRALVGRAGVILRYPQQVRLRTDEEKRESRAGASSVDPRSSESPLVRVAAFAMRPVEKLWESLLVVQLPVPDPEDAASWTVDVAAERDGRVVDRFRVPVPAANRQGGTAYGGAVTVVSRRSLRPGRHDVEVAVTRAGGEPVLAATTSIDVPEIPKKGPFVRGPVLARSAGSGLPIRVGGDAAEGDEALDRLLGETSQNVPLLVNEVPASGAFSAYWEVCLAGGKNEPPEGSMVRRRFLARQAIEAHALPPVPFRIEEGGDPRCVYGVDEIAARTLRAGEYEMEVSLEKPGGEKMAGASAPLEID